MIETGPVQGDVRRWLQTLINGRHLSPAQRRIARYLLDHPDHVTALTAEELGGRCGVSQPSVTRFAVALGFGGYPELREEVGNHLRGPVTGGRGGDDVLGRAVTADIAHLGQLPASPWAGDRLRRVGEHLAASSPLLVAGVRVSRPFAELFTHFAAKVHPDIRLVPAGSTGDDAIAVAARAGATWMFAIGLPRYPTELRQAMARTRSLGLQVALLTDSPLSPLARDADDLLAAPVNSELTFDSATAPLALMMGLLEVIVSSLDQAQARLDEFDQQAAERNLFIT